jgi:hypothetical protein
MNLTTRAKHNAFTCLRRTKLGWMMVLLSDGIQHDFHPQ